MNRDPAQKQPEIKQRLRELSLNQLRELHQAIDREIEARSFADSLEAQMRLFMRRRDQ
ncbi:hypothetical protein [Halorhodospira halophila]|uniref:Uncharacterized protein n=1 Tax=Halorhodospira halophila (strain DSM 244 / SL1) TaxID=349124 RepID=A1WXL5_HALHL|nr:hypothetical protein [Halorhodospira halophila]ABM62427.1 hypothetical protein Hhal_1663 [Halorhodospira halophila SL1]